MHSKVSHCRLCKHTNLVPIIQLGDQAIASQFPLPGEEDPPVIPLTLVKCMGEGSCGLVQLLHTAPPSELYGKTYGYRSGLNATMKHHLHTVVEEALRYVSLENGDTVLDIGSNDGTLLGWYPTHLSLQKIGIDPTGMQFQEFYPNDVLLVPDYFTEASWKKATATSFATKAKAKVITSIAMFYDLPDPLQFARDVQKALHPEGVWIMEQSYLPTMIESNSFDTICHEHLEYYCLRQIEWICAQADLRIVTVSLNEANGGSFRVVLCHKDASHGSSLPDLECLRVIEEKGQYDSLEPYTTFMQSCSQQKRRLQNFLRDVVAQGKKVCLYGASTKGNTLLQYYQLDHTLLTSAAERNPIKYGRRTPQTHIPIVEEEEVRTLHPEYMLVLPWHFKQEFLEREQAYLEEKGQFLFPLPTVHVHSHSRYKKALVTGITGQIGSYMKELLLQKGYLVYGTVQELPPTSEPHVFYLKANLLDKTSLEDIIYTIHPDEIYHFAAVTDSYVAHHSHIDKTLEINSTPVKYFLQILKEYKDTYQRKIPFFQSSSVEIWKGSSKQYYTEKNTHLSPTTPYGISKSYAYWLCTYYREKYQLPIFQGILSSIESPLRKDHFLLKKVVTYIRAYQEHPTMFPLLLGDVHTYRDWVHAADAAEAMYQIVQYGRPEEYIIARGEQVSLQYAIKKAFSLAGIEGEWKDHVFVQETEAGEKVLIHSAANDRVGEEPSLLKTYDSSKLRLLGWMPTRNIHTILRELLHLET